MEINSNHQAYLDSAFRDAIESYGHAYTAHQTPLPKELRKMVIRYFEQDDNAFVTDEILAEAANNIWYDIKRIFRESMLRQGMNAEGIPELRIENLPPLKALSAYTVLKSDATYAVTCTDINLCGTGITIQAAVQDLHQAIRNQYFDDDYRPELDQRNWGKPNPRSTEQQTLLSSVLNQLG